VSEIGQWIKDWGQTLLDLIYLKSGVCRFCQRSWAVGDFSNGCGEMCDECRAVLTAWPQGFNSCSCCGRFFHPHHLPDGDRCTECRSNPLPFAAGGVVGPYAGMLRQAIHWLKYEKRKELARPLGMLLMERVKAIVETASGEDFLVIPVPLHRERLAARGFNQSELLAKEMIQRLGSEPNGPRVSLRADILTRPVETPSQTGLTRWQRQINLVGAFQVAAGKGGELSGRRVLLVDDIITTGSTSGECARVLLEAGSGPVSLGVLAAGVVGK